MGNKKSKQKKQPKDPDYGDCRDSMRKAEETKEKVYRILLLGHSRAGKSTIFKSISFGHVSSYNIDPNDIRLRIRENCIANMSQLLVQSQVLYEKHSLQECKISVTDDIKWAINRIKYLNPTQSFYFCQSFPDLNGSQLKLIGDAVHVIWNLDAIQAIYYKYRIHKKYWFPLNDNIHHFYNKIYDIMNIKYIPSQEDILKTRVPTTGAFEQIFEDEECTNYRIWDVGGQRSERQKWWHNFENIECVICVCGLSAYFATDFVNEEQLQMNECLEEFKYFSNARYFQKSKMVVLLNKTDLFHKYLQITPLTVCFGDEYKGKNYSDFSNDCKRKVCQRLVELIVDDSNIDIGMDIIGIIELYCDLVYEYWVDLVYKDGIEFIKNKFLNLHSDTLFYEVCGVEPESVKQVIQKIKPHLEQNNQQRYVQF